MQKLINVVALLSGLVSLTTVAGTVYLYKNADTMIESAREEIVREISEALPKIIEPLMPNVSGFPKTTGPAIPF